MSFQNKPETEEIIDNTNDASNDGNFNETVGTIVLLLTSVMVILIVFLLPPDLNTKLVTGFYCLHIDF